MDGPSSPQRHSIEARLDGKGLGSIRVNGIDVSESISGFWFDSTVGSCPEIVLHVAQGTPVDLIANDAHIDVYQDVTQWLDNIDATALEVEVLKRTEFGSGSTMSQVLDVLREWAGAEAGEAPDPEDAPTL